VTKTRSSGIAKGVASGLVEAAPELLGALLVPTLDEVARRAHGLIDHAEQAVENAASRAERATQKARLDMEAGAKRAIDRAGGEVKGRIDQAHFRLSDLIDHFTERTTVLLDSFMDRVLALVLAVAVSYGAYFIAHSRGGAASVGGLAALVWMGMTVLSFVIGLAWTLTGRPERLKHVLVWFLYIVALGGLATLVLLAISKAPVF
jgi:hypothetical protein